mgnify:CR=1 FL=1
MNYNVVFVCTGNACRSPFAETVLKQMLKEANINNVDVWIGVAIHVMLRWCLRLKSWVIPWKVQPSA